MSRPVIDINSNTTITAEHSGCDLLVSGGQLTISLPSPIADCDVRIINGDVGNGKILSGFPADLNPKLYPQQVVAVNSDGSIWFTEQNPGRWKLPGNTVLYVNNGPQYPIGNDSNDGLTPQTAILHMATVGQIIQRDFDINQMTPIIAAMAGSAFADELAITGQPEGGNLVQLSLYGSGHVSWVCPGPCISIGDNGELNMAWGALTGACTITLSGNTSNQPQNGTIYQHNNGLFDWSGGPLVTIVGCGTNCSAFFFDGPCPGAAIADGFNIQNTFGDVFRMDEGGGRFTLSGAIVTNGPTIAARLFSILARNELILGGPPSNGDFLSIGASIVEGVLVTNGVSIPGGVTPVNGGVIEVSKP